MTNDLGVGSGAVEYCAPGLRGLKDAEDVLTAMVNELSLIQCTEAHYRNT